MNGKTSLSTQEVAEILDISKNTVYELIKRKELPSYRVGRKIRIDYDDIENYKNKSRTNLCDTKTSIISSNYVNKDNTLANSNSESGKNDKNIIICGQDLILDILTKYLEKHPSKIRALRSYIGSYNGLVELYKGTANVTSVHLWDGETGIYNIPYVRRLLPGFSCILVNLAYRMQGFYVYNGNPKNINDWSDLTKSDVVMINREPGCGVRVLIDEHLRKLGISRNCIAGYYREEYSHLAVASAVARGEADVAVGNEKTALQVSNIDFIPIQKEKLDLVIRKEDLEKPEFKAIIDILNSTEFHKELEGISGYDLSETGKIISET